MAKSKQKMMHSTYFQLKKGSGCAATQSYMAACREFLSSSSGMLAFWVGELASDFQRPVNDRDYDVGMHQVFENVDAFELYSGRDKRHDQFVDEVDRWAVGTSRRVYDSFLTGFEHETPHAGKLPRLMHSIYFTLTEDSDGARAKFSDICQELLSGHPGECVFAIGELADMKRDVSVNNYDVAIDMQWTDKTFYQKYLESKKHDAFFPATHGMIKATQVFDSYLQNEPS